MDTLSINSELNIFNAVLSLAKINDVVIFLCFPILVTVSHRVGRFKLACVKSRHGNSMKFGSFDGN